MKFHFQDDVHSDRMIFRNYLWMDVDYGTELFRIAEYNC